MNVKFKRYNGKWPNLCSRTLVLLVDKEEYIFPQYCLSSGGRVYFTNGYRDSHVEHGEWSVKNWPEGFPEEAKEEATRVINSSIPHGCCGGCI